MGSSAVNRRMAIAGGVCAGGALLWGADAMVHRSGEATSRDSSGAATSDAPAPTPRGAASATTPAPSASVVHTSDQLTAQLDAYRRVRGGTFGVAVYDRRNRTTYRYNAGWRNETLSTIKVLIVAAALRRCQEQGIGLPARQAAQARAMITRSDNDAADLLLPWVGPATVRRVARLYGLTDTAVRGGVRDGEPDWWGYSTTTADDMVRLVRALTWGGQVLHRAHRDYLKTLMAQVVPAQRWGVCAPPLPADLTWQTKNGWGAREDAYRANSMGHIRGHSRDYVAVVLSRSRLDPVYTVERSYAFATVSGISRILYAALARPLG